MSNAPPQDMSLQWRAWFDGLPQDRQEALLTAWGAVGDLGVQESHRNADYARRASLLAQSEAFGYVA